MRKSGAMVWGLAYKMLGLFANVRSAMLYSLGAMTTFGAGSLSLPSDWLMIGCSTVTGRASPIWPNDGLHVRDDPGGLAASSKPENKVGSARTKVWPVGLNPHSRRPTWQIDYCERLTGSI